MAKVGELTVTISYEPAVAALAAIRELALGEPSLCRGSTSSDRLAAIARLAAEALAKCEAVAVLGHTTNPGSVATPPRWGETPARPSRG